MKKIFGIFLMLLVTVMPTEKAMAAISCNPRGYTTIINGKTYYGRQVWCSDVSPWTKYRVVIHSCSNPVLVAAYGEWKTPVGTSKTFCGTAGSIPTSWSTAYST